MNMLRFSATTCFCFNTKIMNKYKILPIIAECNNIILPFSITYVNKKVLLSRVLRKTSRVVAATSRGSFRVLGVLRKTSGVVATTLFTTSRILLRVLRILLRKTSGVVATTFGGSSRILCIFRFLQIRTKAALHVGRSRTHECGAGVRSG